MTDDDDLTVTRAMIRAGSDAADDLDVEIGRPDHPALGVGGDDCHQSELRPEK